ncbi:hypothetical protein [Bacillus sp. FJAT-49736]|uniref:hypothetical protein n=1 Tax=Bacillus sp. FJAT-49736 TaxID=2833582 RepID=UPI001BC9B8F3|nr:hypothetical protein [Bacillus sp. FJAT-49736]MBS4171956.1 hypothetical protein [Bacillus sp. FJAT-49736]
MNENKKKPFYKLWWFWLIAVIVVLGAIGAVQESNNGNTKAETKQSTTNKQKEKKTTTPKSLEEKIADDINKKLGSKSNTKKKRIVELVALGESNDKLVNIKLSGDSILTNNFTRQSLLSKSGDVFQSIYKNKDVSKVTVFWQMPLVDSYGKESDQNVLNITLTRDTYNKIDWKNFNYENYKQIADSYFMHPALLKK